MVDYPIRTEGLTKVYDGVKAVDSLDLSVDKGQVFGFLGPNGSGKTTTIGMMVGLIEPTAGKCFINGMDVVRNPMEVKRITGYLPDGVGFYSGLTARQNLKYFAKLYEMKNADARIAELLEYVGLGGVDKPAGTFSRGMKQRLGLAQALLNDPEVIFLDEPTNGLDPQGVIRFREIVKEQVKEGKTIFFSSHILEEVQHVCSTIGILLNGRLIALGTPDEIKRSRDRSAVRIRVKVSGAMPHLSDPRIIEASYSDGGASIKASADIRDDISRELIREGLAIRELAIDEETLEDVFLETVYGGV
ncbi:ABC transporter ATP-binding protein [Methanocella conradii]|uniref:ABC transporter ATP-binding protein n=1 Tax=Methanocella conradii TaxID=1175444 RepID=UPI00157D092A|nr:ABC transporter ATP-binding protein [Methanocella conradii]